MRKNILGGYTRIVKEEGVYYIPDVENEIVFSVQRSSKDIVFSIERLPEVKEFYIYIDINRLNKVGIEKSLGESFTFYPSFAWEYAFSYRDDKVSLYRISGRDYRKIKDFPVLRKEDSIYFTVSRTDIEGNFINWDYILSCYFQDGSKKGIYILINDRFLKPVR